MNLRSEYGLIWVNMGEYRLIRVNKNEYGVNKSDLLRKEIRGGISY